MATLVLTAAGQALGGRIGSAIGALIGQQIDSRLFAPKARQGPRLGDLSVQTSSYGSQIPKLFGTMRVAGTVIWATDLREERTKNGGGKGQPKTVNYSYSANFAVLLSARAVRAVRRIWADGKLLRGEAGDFKTASQYRLHLGGEDQAPDPLIASAEGAGGTPAYRGLAYAVFEDFQLAEYGNRIPSLTFEVEADEGPVGVGRIAATLAPELAVAETIEVAGYAAAGESVRAAVEALADLEPLSLTDTQAVLTLARAGSAEPVAIGRGELDSKADRAGGRSDWSRRSADTVASEATLAYYEPSRDYQSGLQRAARGGPGLRSDRRAVAAALSADVAKALAERRLDALWAERRSAKVNLPPARLAIAAGAVLAIPGKGSWRVVRATLENMVLTLDLVGRAADAGPIPAAAAGVAVVQPDQIHGATRLVLLDVPLGSEDLPSRPRLLVAAAGEGEGWRRAGLLASDDGGANWREAGDTAPAATMGTAVTVPGPAASALLDLRAAMTVELASTSMWLESRSDAALAAGDNLAALGDELIQFGVAEPIGPRTFRLSRLLRGRRGTEWATAGHAGGEPFVLIEAESLANVDFPPVAVGASTSIMATGVGDPDGVVASRTLAGDALRPPSPVHLRARRLAGGDVVLSWVRRSRSGWVWLSGSDTPLGEESERYRVAFAAGDVRREFEAAEPGLLYTAAAQAADGLTGELRIEVVQLGTNGPSRPAATILNPGD
ncbi:MAG TPA: phage tail protein [Allosphingosinicella sp.]|nr:phage tail protein [Allosphingosinicella sp.]